MSNSFFRKASVSRPHPEKNLKPDTIGPEDPPERFSVLVGLREDKHQRNRVARDRLSELYVPRGVVGEVIIGPAQNKRTLLRPRTHHPRLSLEGPGSARPNSICLLSKLLKRPYCRFLRSGGSRPGRPGNDDATHTGGLLPLECLRVRSDGTRSPRSRPTVPKQEPSGKFIQALGPPSRDAGSHRCSSRAGRAGRGFRTYREAGSQSPC